MSGWISASQFERDHNGLRNACAACGHDGSEANPLVVSDDGSRIHTSHTTDTNSGYYAATQSSAADTSAWWSAERTAERVAAADTNEM